MVQNPSTQTKKILIIEDGQELLQVLKLRFEKMGYEVYLADNGREGLEILYEQTPDVVLLDLILPDTHGNVICKMIREDEREQIKTTPVLMLTGKNSEVDRVLGMVVGANAYITKPDIYDALDQEIEKIYEYRVQNCRFWTDSTNT